MIPIILNLCLGVFKYVCASISDLASIGADAANNLTDAITSLLTALGVKMASMLGRKRHETDTAELNGWLELLFHACLFWWAGKCSGSPLTR